MTIVPTIEYDTAGFVSACRDLMKISGQDFVPVLLVQTAKIIAFCIKHTKAAPRAKIIASVARNRSQRFEFPDGEVIILSKRHPGDISFLDVSGKRHDGKKTKYSLDGKTWHSMNGNFHWSDERWAKYQSFLAQMQAAQGQESEKGGNRYVKLKKGADLEAALGSRGNLKHSYYQIAEDIGNAANLDVPQWVRDAKPQDGRTWQNGRATVMLEGAAAFIEIFNDHPAAIRLDGQTLVNYAIISRAKAFEREVDLGVFRDIKTRAERYPGLFVSN